MRVFGGTHPCKHLSNQLARPGRQLATCKRACMQAGQRVPTMQLLKALQQQDKSYSRSNKTVVAGTGACKGNGTRCQSKLQAGTSISSTYFGCASSIYKLPKSSIFKSNLPWRQASKFSTHVPEPTRRQAAHRVDAEATQAAGKQTSPHPPWRQASHVSTDAAKLTRRETAQWIHTDEQPHKLPGGKLGGRRNSSTYS